MSCEGCSQKFTVFKRKKLCNICLRHFCSQCLSPQLGASGNNSMLSRLTDRRLICATCLVLTARPLCRLQLKRLKVKDLQHYLTAQRVSTRGCVEKDDLVNLLIRHVGSSNTGSSGRQENVCNSHSDLSMGSEQNSSANRPPPPRNLPRGPGEGAGTQPTNLASNPATSSSGSSTRNASNPTINITGASPSRPVSANVTGAGSSANGANVRSRRHSPEKTTPDSDNGFEIVELTEDWSGELDDHGPEPVVEEISDSTGVSSPTSAGGDPPTLSSSTTSLGEPNITTSSSSSPSHERLPADEPSTAARGEGEAEAERQPAAEEGNSLEPKPPVITLNTIKSLKEFDRMSVKQIKDLLMRNRVDFRGCCERTELVERVTRLWLENQESKKAFEQLGTAEMCKICMDAPIECVMLECGHMATCMSCGKQLNECPLCRQYVVRVVRTFRA